MYAENRETIVDRREMLRVKCKSLAAEARIIRAEERRTHGALRDELRNHRVLVVRSEARHAYLAYGFVRGRSYVSMEPRYEIAPNWTRVRPMLKKYGPRDFVEPACMNAPVKVAA